MNLYKVCFWLNVPSNHQTLFLEALNKDKRVDLQVRYFDKPSEDRLKIGWRDENSLHEYEQYVVGPNEALKTLDDWKERIHITTGYSYPFNRVLIPLLIEKDIKWVHWSERYGIGLAQRLNYNIILFKLLRPFFLLTKRSYGKLVNKYALGCFAQGKLARKDFISIGISDSKIEDLYYTTAPLDRTDKTSKILKDFSCKHHFLYVGRLNKRKGIEELLRAYTDLTNTNEWGLVLVGNDETNGYLKKMAEKLGIGEKVLFVGGIKADKVSSYFSAANVFVLPSRFDGWGAVVNEASSIGLPLIASDQTGAALHLIKDGENGFIIAAGQTRALTNAMQKYISDSTLLLSHGKFSQKIFNDFSPQNNVLRFISSLNKWHNIKVEK